LTAGVITFSNQTGVNGNAIAQAVAERLRYRFFDWEVIAQAATQAGVSPDIMAVATAERPPNLIERLVGYLVAGGPEVEETVTPPPGGRLSIFRSENYRQIIEEVVRELGRRGDCVIVGHAGQMVLREFTGVLKVLLRGSRDKRIERIVANQNVDRAAAALLVDDFDRQRKEFFRRVYKADWLDAGNYDLILNTDRVSVDLARDMIVATAREVP
jgi:hypothetical protein